MSTPNDMRTMIGYMRGKEVQIKETPEDKNKDLTMRDMLKLTRVLNEEEEVSTDVEVSSDQQNEEMKIKNYFDARGMLVSFKFGELIVKSNSVFWSFIVNSTIRVAFKVTGNENKSGVIFEYIEEANPESLEEIADEIKDYFENYFKEFWLSNLPTK